MNLNKKDININLKKDCMQLKNNGFSKPPHYLQLLSYLIFFGNIMAAIFIFIPLVKKKICVLIFFFK